MVGSALTLLAGILLAGGAVAQQAPVQVRRELSIILDGAPAAPLPELRAAPEVATLIFFDADLALDTLEVDQSRIQLVGTGPRFILFKPVVRLGAEERVILRVRYLDGHAPAQAEFAIVSHPSEVNPRVEVTRRAQLDETGCQAALAGARAACAPLTPTRAARAGLWGEAGVMAALLDNCTIDGSSALSCQRGSVYVAEGWALVRVSVVNAPGQPPWAPREATLRGQKTGAQLHVRTVEAAPAVIGPGGTGEVFVEFDGLKNGAELLTLELRGAGRSLTVVDVKLAAPVRKEDAKP